MIVNGAERTLVVLNQRDNPRHGACIREDPHVFLAHDPALRQLAWNRFQSLGRDPDDGAVRHGHSSHGRQASPNSTFILESSPCQRQYRPAIWAKQLTPLARPTSEKGTCGAAGLTNLLQVNYGTLTASLLCY